MPRRILPHSSLAIFFAAYSLATTALTDEPPPVTETRPQWQRTLTGDDAKRAIDLSDRIAAAERAGSMTKRSNSTKSCWLYELRGKAPTIGRR